MKWSKKGLIVEPGGFDWMMTHAQNPFPEKITESRYRIHFAGRDAGNMARGGYAVIDINHPEHILDITEKPYLDLGELGCFDDCGAMPSCIVDYEDRKYLYYTGWTQQRLTPFSFFIGLCISDDGGRSYHRYSKAPILGRTFYDPFMTASPYVIKEGSTWKMWYVSCTGWQKIEDCTSEKARLKHYYHIRYAESYDGIVWDAKGLVCIDFKEDEYAIARPIVFREDGIYKMWYCYRGGANTYRAGYSESLDGICWVRKDEEVGIDVSNTGWDSEMICYPCVFNHGLTKYMLYNGNGYGATGCGLAALREEQKNAGY